MTPSWDSIRNKLRMKKSRNSSWKQGPAEIIEEVGPKELYSQVEPRSEELACPGSVTDLKATTKLMGRDGVKERSARTWRNG